MDLSRIAFVEDEDDIRMLTEMALETIGGFDVCAYPSGPEALEQLEGFCPDIILLDVMMPGMDGKELFGHIRSRPGLAGIPIAFMTAKVLDPDRNELTELGAVGVIAKPYDPMTLPQDVRALWERHAELNC